MFISYDIILLKHICLKKDILYACRTQIHVVRNMWKVFAGMLETLTNNLEILTPTLLVCFAAYAMWYFTSAKCYAPLTLKEARLLWRIHKQEAQCKAKKWQKIMHKNKIIGFECECGYKHVQKRPITANTPTLHIHSQTPIYKKLHSST